MALLYTTMMEEFCEFLAEKLSLDPAKIKALHAEFSGSRVEAGQSSGKCGHQFKTGKNKGTFCGAGESVKGSGRCKKHAVKEEEPAKEEKPVVEKKKPASKAADKDKTGLENKPIADVVDKRRGELIITLNGWNNWENKNTGFVFDRATKAVIGKQLPNGTIGVLNANDVQLCNLNNWKYAVAAGVPVAGPVVAVGEKKGSVDIASEDEADVDSDLEDLYE